MKLIEAEQTGPVEGEDAIVTPPRPPHRRVSVSLLFTLAVLVGTVVAVYTAFPARHNVLVTEAIDRHREPPTWDLVSPSAAELRAWAIGVVGKDAPLPAGKPLGARRIELFNRGAALILVRVDGGDITYLVQHARGVPPEHQDRIEGDLRAVAWTKGKFVCVAVGPAATSSAWLRQITGG